MDLALIPAQPKPMEAVEIVPPAAPVALAMAPVPDDPGPEVAGMTKKRGWFG